MDWIELEPFRLEKPRFSELLFAYRGALIPSLDRSPASANVGSGKFGRPKGPYDRFMEDEGVPIYRGVGVHKVQNLPMKPWKRLGGNGSYIQLFGIEALWGLYIVEVPAGGALNVERHLYEKTVLVVEGRGSTEIWQEGQTKKQMFEWQPYSMFSVPLNSYHKIVK